MELEIFTPSKEGYEAVHSFESWTVAYLTYAERFDNITQLERHNKTDEIFVLLEGSAVLLIGEDAKQVKMEKNKMYNVKKGVWHNVMVSKDALLMIVENSNTSVNNSEYIPFNQDGKSL